MTEFARDSTAVATASGEDLDLRRYITVLWRRRRLVAGSMLVALAMGIGVGELRPPQYEAEAVIQLSDDGDRLFAGSALAARFVRSQAFLTDVAAAVGPPAGTEMLARGLRAESVRDGQVLRLRFRHSSPEVAYRVTRAMAEAFVVRASEPIETTRSQIQRRIRNADTHLAEVRELRELSRKAFTATVAGTEGSSVQHTLSQIVAVNALVQIETLHQRAEDRREDLLVRLDELKLPAVLQPASMPAASVAPRRAHYVAVALVLGFFVGTAVAALYESWSSLLPSARRLQSRSPSQPSPHS